MAFTEEEGFVRRLAREFAENEIEPVAAEREREGGYPWGVARAAAESDLTAPTVPEEHGGGGLGLTAGLIVNEELHRADPGIAESVMAVNFGCESILEYGTDEQIDRYVEPASNAEIVTGVAMTEPEVGSDFANISTSARRDGEGWVIDGEKVFVSNGSIADALVVYARTSDTEEPHRGISAFLVETDRPGVDQVAMEGYLGPATVDLGQIHLDGVRVPEDALLGEEDGGFYQAMAFLDEARLEVAASSVGTAQGALDRAIEYLEEREQFGEPIGTNQALRHRVAALASRVEAARALVYRTARRVEDGDLEDPSRPAMAKLVATQLAEEVASEAVQLHGGYGVFREYRVESFLRSSKAPQIYEGTNEIMREVVADALLDV